MNELTELETRADTEARHAHRELVEQLETKLAGAVAECERIGRLWHDAEAKLAKAVGALDKIKRIDNLVGVFAACERTLAELEGEKT